MKGLKCAAVIRETAPPEWLGADQSTRLGYYWPQSEGELALPLAPAPWRNRLWIAP